MKMNEMKIYEMSDIVETKMKEMTKGAVTDVSVCRG